jgi:DUF1680 family protein
MVEHLNQGRRRLLGGFIAIAARPPRTSAAGSQVIDPAAPLAELRHGQVQLSPGPLASQASENQRLVLSLDEDSLLLPYRLRAGLPAPGHELGGWYDTYAFAPGAQYGQWMSALARYHAITGDGPAKAKVRRMVRGFAATIDAHGRFYERNRFPCYTYDKLVGGLLDAARLCADEVALPTLARATTAALPHLPAHVMPRNEHQHLDEFSHYSWDESYTLPENQFLAWRATGDRRHFDLGRRMLYDEFFGALARGENVLPGKHAYSHVNALSSALQGYFTLGKPMYLEAAKRGFDMIAAQSYATGGWGPAEHFIVPGGGALGASLEHEHNTFETPCGAYAHFKLTRYLLRITRDSRYGDSMERVLYNTVLGALPIRADGRAFYNSDYSTRAVKGFFQHRWPCCSGTLPMIAADYAISACFTDAEGIFVNLYVPAVVTWSQKGQRCSLTMETDYPYEPLVVLTVQLPRAQTFALNVRIPGWAAGAGLAINGRREPTHLEPGTFASLSREWRAGDRIELELPLGRGLESIDTLHPDTVALRAGPLVLMRILDEHPSGPIPRANLLAARRDTAGAHAWQLATEGATVSATMRDTVTLKAFPDIATEPYSVYQQVMPS